MRSLVATLSRISGVTLELSGMRRVFLNPILKRGSHWRSHPQANSYLWSHFSSGHWALLWGCCRSRLQIHRWGSEKSYTTKFWEGGRQDSASSTDFFTNNKDMAVYCKYINPIRYCILVHAPADDNRSGASFPQTVQSVEIILRNTGLYSNEIVQEAHIDPMLTKKVV